MVRHASSHSFSVLICTILAAFLIEILKPLMPRFMTTMEDLSYRLVTVFSIPINVDSFTIILIASLLAILWGMFFKLSYNKR